MLSSLSWLVAIRFIIGTVLLFLLLPSQIAVSSTVHIAVTDSRDFDFSSSNCSYQESSLNWSEIDAVNTVCSIRSAWSLCHGLVTDYNFSSPALNHCVIEISPSLSQFGISWNSTLGELPWYHSKSGISGEAFKSNATIEIQGHGVTIRGDGSEVYISSSNDKISSGSSLVQSSEFPLTTSGLSANYADSIGSTTGSVEICQSFGTTDHSDNGLLLEFSSCIADGGQANGDTYFSLYEEDMVTNAMALVEENDDYCSLGSYISYAIPPLSTHDNTTVCKRFTLEVECHYSTIESCNATVQFNLYRLPVASRFIAFYSDDDNQDSASSFNGNMSLILSNLTLSGFGGSYLDGGAVYVEEGLSLEIDACTLTGNQGRNGGAIYKILSPNKDGENVMVKDSVITNNTAGYMGGGVYVTGPSVGSSCYVDLSNNTWYSNHATHGGAIAIDSFVSNVFLTSSSFDSNTAYYGGSIYIHENNTGLMLDTLSFSKDYALSTGGSIRIESNNQDIIGSNMVLKGCSAGILGGSISVGSNNQDIVLSDVIISSSFAKHGGAIAFEVNNRNIGLYNHSLQNCIADGGHGGCFYFRRSNSNITMSEITMLSISATTGSGGGMYFYSHNEDIWIEKLTTNDSYAGTSGSVIFLGYYNYRFTIRDIVGSYGKSSLNGGMLMVTSYCKYIDIENVYASNFLGSAGGLINIDTANSYFTFRNLTVSNCNSTLRGCLQFQSYNSYMTLTDITIKNAVSTQGEGAALYLYVGNTDMTITGLNAYSCVSGNGGAVSMYQSNYRIRFISCNFNENTGLSNAGAVYVQIMNSFIDFVSCTFTNNVALDGNGGALALESDNKYISVIAGVSSPIVVETAHPYVSGYPLTDGSRYIIMSQTVSISNAIGYIIFFDTQSTIFAYDTFGIYEDTTKTTRYYYRDSSQLSNINAYWPGTYRLPLSISGSTLYFEFLGPSSLANQIVSSLYGFRAYIYPIYSTSDTLSSKISYSMISNNVASGKGGAIYWGQNNRYVAFVNTMITNNQAISGGGGMSFGTINGLIAMKYVTIDKNTAISGDGGGLEIRYSQFGMSMADTWITNNYCGGSGGAAFLDAGNGVGLMITANTIAFDNVAIVNNSATVGGGGIAIHSRNTVSFNALTIQDNTCSALTCAGGGAIILTGTNTVTITSVNIVGNSASGFGGGISASGIANSITMTNVNIQGNAASVAGGAVYASTQTTLSLLGNHSWSANSATFGGALAILSTSKWSVGSTSVSTRFELIGNTATKGSAMFLANVDTSKTMVSGTSSELSWKVADNTASDGGTVFWYYNNVMASPPAFLSSSKVIWSKNKALYGVIAATQTVKSVVKTYYSVMHFATPLDPPLPVEFFDYYGQRVGDISGASVSSDDWQRTVQVGLVDTSNNTCSFSKLTSHTVVSGGLDVANGSSSFTDVYVQCEPDGITTIGYTVRVTDLAPVLISSGVFTSDNTYYELTNTTTLYFRDCVNGEYLQDGECLTCPESTFKLTNDKAEDCQECLTMDGVDSCYGDQLILLPGYYRRSPSHKTILACPLGGVSCIGGNGTGAGLCGVGFTGELCSYCADGYFLDDGLCKPCVVDGEDQGSSTSKVDLKQFMTPSTIVVIAVIAFLTAIILCIAILVVTKVATLADIFFFLPTTEEEQTKLDGTKVQVTVINNELLMEWWSDFTAKAKLVITTYQIVAAATSVMNVKFPRIFLRFVAAISVLNPQIFSMMSSVQCEHRFTFVDQLLASTIGPFIVWIFLVLFSALHIWWLEFRLILIYYQRHKDIITGTGFGVKAIEQSGTLWERWRNRGTWSRGYYLSRLWGVVKAIRHYSRKLYISFLVLHRAHVLEKNPTNIIDADETTDFFVLSKEEIASIAIETSKLRDKYMNIMLFISYLILPSVTTTIFQIFLCTDVDPNNEDTYQYDYYLTADMAMECGTDYYKKWVAYASVMILVYPVGIPCIYYYLLRKHSYAIVYQDKVSEKELEEAKRIGFLWQAYEPGFWYWEIVECTRRIMLTAVLSVVSPGSSTQNLFGIVLALFYIRIYGFYRPYEEDSDDALGEFAQFEIFFVFLASLIIGYNLVSSTWFWGIGFILVAMNVFTMIYTLWLHIQEIMDAVKQHNKKNNKEEQKKVPSEKEDKMVKDSSLKVTKPVESVEMRTVTIAETLPQRIVDGDVTDRECFDDIPPMTPSQPSYTLLEEENAVCQVAICVKPW